MARSMLITVGTSLLHSASWELDAGLHQEIQRYEGWLRDAFKASPELRQGDVRSAEIRAGLKKWLRLDNTGAWTARLPRDLRAGSPVPSTLMRYSAELSTILKLAESSEAASAREFLGSYERVELAVDPVSYEPDGANSVAVIAAHLAAYLDAVAGKRVASLRQVNGISSRDPQVVLAALLELRGALARSTAATDLVLSGGYKSYGIVLAPLAGRQVRLVFLHEAADDLMLYDGRTLEMGGSTVEWVSGPPP